MRKPTDLEIVAKVSAHFGLRLLSAVRVAEGFSGAEVFHIHADDEREYAARRIAVLDNTQNRRAIQLHQLLRFLSSRGIAEISVPLVVSHPGDLRLAEQTILSDESGHWQIEPWLPGFAIESAGIKSDHVNSTVRLLHKWHTLAAIYAADQPADRPLHRTTAPAPAVSRRLALVNSIDKLLLHKWREAARRDCHTEFGELALAAIDLMSLQQPSLLMTLSRISSQKFPLQPVIRDLHADHVLFVGDNVTGFIDLNACTTDHVCNDLVRLCRSWFGADNRRVCEFIAAYEELHPLDSDGWKLLRALDRCNVFLNPLTWLQRRYDDGRLTQTEQPQVIRRLHELVAIAGQFEPL